LLDNAKWHYTFAIYDEAANSYRFAFLLSTSESFQRVC
jgi:hypothetical protein